MLYLATNARMTLEEIKTLSLLLILSLSSGINSQVNPLPEVWKIAILSATQNFQAPTMMITGPPTPIAPIITAANDSMAVLCPDILLWSPLEQYQNLLTEEVQCPVCASSGIQRIQLSPSRWQQGTSERTQPRKIHTSRSIVLLVSRVYKCSQGHEILGHDPSIIDCIPPWLVPFLLWHKTGVTKQLVDDISILIDAGVPITSIESLLLKHRRMDYVRKSTIFKALAGSMNESHTFPSFETWSNYFPAISPCWHTIGTCFQVDFSQKKDLFIRHMQQMTVSDEGGWLSCDHTFASAGKLYMQNSLCAPT